MTKTFEDYYNDPGIVNEHPVLRQIHAIRLMHYEERKLLSDSEYIDLVIKNTEPFMIEYRKKRGLPPANCP